MRLDFSGEIWYWRGPSPFHFVTVPARESEDIRSVAALVTYGWGVIPVEARIGATRWTTSLFPRDGGYALPVRADIRRAEGIALGDVVRVSLFVRDEY